VNGGYSSRINKRSGSIGASLPPKGNWFVKPECEHSDPHEERRPRSFIASVMALTVSRAPGGVAAPMALRARAAPPIRTT
jgi:hypothetical protein